MNLDSGFLFASLLWGGIGLGFFIFGKKQRSTGPLLGGIVLMAISYLISSALWMSVVGAAVLFGIYLWCKNN